MNIVNYYFNNINIIIQKINFVVKYLKKITAR